MEKNEIKDSLSFDIIDVAKNIAKEKGIDEMEVIEAMEMAIAKAGRTKYGFELDIRRLTQTINTNPRRSRLSDLYIARGNSKRRLLETKLKRKLTKSDDNIGMCTDYKKGLVLFSKPSDYTNKPPSYIKKLLKEYCKLSFWESIKFSFK